VDHVLDAATDAAAAAKGMVLLDPRLEGDALALRQSMIKFEGSTSTDIEICDAESGFSKG
jgi:hypothetical protein